MMYDVLFEGRDVGICPYFHLIWEFYPLTCRLEFDLLTCNLDCEKVTDISVEFQKEGVRKFYAERSRVRNWIRWIGAGVGQFDLWLLPVDGVFYVTPDTDTPPASCRCRLDILMASGCQCGGK